jgi:predicted GNAT family acetyltransferase
MLLDTAVSAKPVDVRRIEMRELESYATASAAMFAAEVGIDPNQLNAVGYRLRVQDTIRQGRAYGLVDDHGVTRFKTDVGCVSDGYCQIQGVWLHPDWRGQGRAVDLLAQAIAVIQREVSPAVCLYVNDFNRPALATYLRLGFKPIAEFSTIFF